MNVLVDTTIWSLAIRRKRKTLNPEERGLQFEFLDLVKANRVVLIAPIYQEVLSGIQTDAAFDWVRDYLRAFNQEHLSLDDYEAAAKCWNRCAGRGVFGTSVDFLLCAVALRAGLSIFTTDRDFGRIARVLSIHLHAPSDRPSDR